MIFRRNCLHYSPAVYSQFSFREALLGCITGAKVTRAGQRLLDHRFFHVVDGQVACTSGIARHFGIQYLQRNDFLNARWFDAFRIGTANPTTLGFLLEQMILSYLSIEPFHALAIHDRRFGERPQMRHFKGRAPPPTINGSGLQLYIPTVFNHPAIDAILVCLDAGNEKRFTKAAVARIQVTISKDHPGSHKVFMNDWKEWRWCLGCDIGDNQLLRCLCVGKCWRPETRGKEAG